MFQKIKWMLGVLLICQTQLTIAQSKVATQKLTPQQLKDDLAFLLKTFENVHVNLYENVSRKKVKAYSKALKAKFTQPMSALEFYRLTAPLANLFQDGHTTFLMPMQVTMKYLRSGKRMLPFQVKMDASYKVYIRYNMDSLEVIPKGSEVISINGQNAQQMSGKLIKYFPGESIEFRRRNAQGFFPFVLWTIFGMKGNFTIVYKEAQTGKQNVVHHAGISYQKWRKKRAELRAKKNISFKPYSYRQYAPQVGLLTVNTFRARGGALKKYLNFLKTTFYQIKKQNITSLVIDVRQNGGGNSSLGDSLLNYISDKPWVQFAKTELKVSNEIKAVKYYKNNQKVQKAKVGTILVFSGEKILPQKNNSQRFKGKVYILSGTGSFSSASSFVAAVKGAKIGTIIGEPTGGVAVSFGDLHFFKLPYTQLQVGVSFKRFVVCPDCKYPNRGIPADHAVKDSNPDDARDEVLEYALKLIRK